MRTDYYVEIEETSKELTKRERVMLKDMNDSVGIDKLPAGTKITPLDWAILKVHNEKAKGDKDYKILCIRTANENGEIIKLTTGSESFKEAFFDIAEEMNGEEYSIKLNRQESKNYSGKQFLTCSLV